MQGFIARTIAVGFVSGYLSGQLGVGGGLLTTPAIRLVLKYPAPIAVGTPLVVMIPGALMGVTAYARERLVDWPLAARVGGSGLVGVLAGAGLTGWVDGSVIMIMTAILMIVLAARMAIRGRRESDGDEEEARAGPAAAYGLGLATGVFSGFLGLGGGVVMIPAFIGLFGCRAKTAFGTSLAVIALLAVPGSIAHYVLGHVDLRLALPLAIGIVPGALVGARLAIRAPDRLLRLGFAGFLAVAGAVLGTNEIVRMLW